MCFGLLPPVGMILSPTVDDTKDGTVSDSGWVEDDTVYGDDTSSTRPTPSMICARGIVVH